MIKGVLVSIITKEKLKTSKKRNTLPTTCNMTELEESKMSV